jgi:hypothetical protein
MAVVRLLFWHIFGLTGLEKTFWQIFVTICSTELIEPESWISLSRIVEPG